jgi:predicted nuclease of predicted toxin-antitoxin system
VKLLLDHCVDGRLAAHFPAHEVHTTASLGWEQLRNGQLPASAAASGFDAVLTTDKGIKHQQNLATLPVAVVILRARSNRLVDLVPLVSHVENALGSLVPRRLVEVEDPALS